MDNGGGYRILPFAVDCKYSPEDDSLHTPSDRYYFVNIDYGHLDVAYDFLIHAEPDLSPPNEKRIGDSFNVQSRLSIPGGKDWWDYLDFDSELTQNHPRVIERLSDGEQPSVYGPPSRIPAPPSNQFWA